MSEDEMAGFPAWRYHKSKKAVVVKNAEEEEALGEGWEDSPAKFKAEKQKKEAEQAGIQRRCHERFDAARNDGDQQGLILREYASSYPEVASTDPWYLRMSSLIPAFQVRAVETIESHAVASPAPPQARAAGTRKGAAPIDNLIPVAASSEERAETVARIIAELNTLEPQMYGEASYEELKEHHPDFLTFKVSEQRNDLKVLLVNIQRSKRHFRLAQQCAAHYHGKRFVTIKDDWKHNKPENFRSKKARKGRSKS